MPEDDEDFQKIKNDPRFASVKKLIRSTIDELVAESKASKIVPKKKNVPPVVADDDDDGDENIFDVLFGPKK